MPSGAAAAQEGVHAAELGAALSHEGAGGGRVKAVLQARAGAAGTTLGGARSGAEAAMHPTTAVLHRRLAAAAAGAGMGAAARGGQEIAGLGAVAQASAAVDEQWQEGGTGFMSRRCGGNAWSHE